MEVGDLKNKHRKQKHIKNKIKPHKSLENCNRLENKIHTKL